MNFSEHLRALAAPIWKAQLHHPFVVALGKGTLPLQKFRYYILQDARYLEELAKVRKGRRWRHSHSLCPIGRRNNRCGAKSS
jgi:hypothetical protein